MDNTKLSQLPYMKHFEASEIGKSIDTFRKGEKGLFNTFKLVVLCGLGYLAWVYVLPPVFKALGELFAIVATLVGVAICIALIPAFLRFLRAFTRKVHERAIKYDPFGPLYEKRREMDANKKTFQMAKAKISQLKTDMEISRDESEKNAEKLQDLILKLQGKAKQLKSDMDDMVAKGGAAAKGTDDYVNAHSEFLKVGAAAERKGHEYNQEKTFVQKYGARGSVMRKMSQKLVMIETSMDIKILDYDATIEILKKDWEYAKKAKEATNAARSTMLFDSSWEVEFAMDVVVSTIAMDNATTAGNIKDIDTAMLTYAMDSDDLYDNLNKLAEDIKVGKNPIPDAKQYSNPEYKLTQADRQATGFGEDIF